MPSRRPIVPRRHRVAKSLPRADARDGHELWQVIVCHRELIGRACAQRLGHRPEAEDAAQDVAVRAATEGPAPDEVVRLAALARQEVDRRRWWDEHHGGETVGLLPSPDGLDPGEVALQRMAIADAVSRLSETERTAVGAVAAGYSLSEAAWRLGISINAFKGRLRAARTHLRALGVGLGAALAGLLRRLRARRRDASPRTALALRAALERVIGSGAGAEIAGHTFLPAALALVVLVSTASPVPTMRRTAGTGRSMDGVAAVAPSGGPAAPRSQHGVGAHTLKVREHPLGTLHPLDPRAGDTIDDTQLTTATAAADFESTHTIVGLGTGANCGCPLLYRTMDGGRTWESTKPGVVPAVARGATIALPPTYPHDPRIFIGNPAQPGLFDYAAAAYREPFTSLPLPPGQLAVSAGFDEGDPRLFDATSVGVVSYRVDSGEEALAVAEPRGDSETPALLTTPYGDMVAAVVMVTTGASWVPPATSVRGPALLICPRSGPCQPRPDDGLPSGGLAVVSLSPRFALDRTLLVATKASAALSTDAGATFHEVSALALPDGAQLIGGTLTSTQAWAVVGRDSGQGARVLSVNLAGGAWSDVTDRDPRLSAPGVVLAASSDDVIDIVLDVAVRCTVDSGLSWHTFCPA